MNYLYNTIHSIVSRTIDNIIPSMNTYFVFAFLGASRLINQINFGKKITQYSPPIIIHYTSQLYTYYITWSHYIHSILYKYRIEPRELSWVNNSSIELIYPNINTTKYNYSEIYEYQNFDQYLLFSHFNTLILQVSTKNFIDDHDNTSLLSIKYDNKYVYRIQSISKQSKTAHLSLETIKSCFLSIVYTHPKMEHPIHMQIPENAILIGNEILSSIFVLRYLEYQSFPFIFDLNYSLQLIDNHINQITLKCHQYILLQSENEYKVLCLYP